jgi:hypothetical protein
MLQVSRYIHGREGVGNEGDGEVRRLCRWEIHLLKVEIKSKGP